MKDYYNVDCINEIMSHFAPVTQPQISERDGERIAKAKKMDPIDWAIVSQLEREAENEDACKELHYHAGRLYHTEEGENI